MRACLLVIALGVSVGLAACAEPATAGPPARTGGLRFDKGTATVTTSAGKVLGLQVEIATKPELHALGMMYRKSLPPEAGMVFVFDAMEVREFWMENTLIPLDMLFIDANGKIVGIVENAEPLTRTSRTVGVPSKFVLEVNGGWSARHGVKAGDRFSLDGV